MPVRSFGKLWYISPDPFPSPIALFHAILCPYQGPFNKNHKKLDEHTLDHYWMRKYRSAEWQQYLPLTLTLVNSWSTDGSNVSLTNL